MVVRQLVFSFSMLWVALVCCPIGTLAMGELRAIPPFSSKPDTTQSDSSKKEFQIKIWSPADTQPSQITATDSLLRWRTSRTLSGWLSDQSQGQMLRMGTSSRTEAFQLFSMEARHASLEFESMELSDPISGQALWDIIPYGQISSISQVENGIGSSTIIRLKEHYVRDPRLYLTFFESGAAIRDLNILYTHNISRRLNLELGYDDMSDATSYRGMDAQATRIQARLWYQLSSKIRLKAGVLDYTSTTDESFGYTTGSMLDFSFDPLTVRPLVSTASREYRSVNSYVLLQRLNQTTSIVKRSDSTEDDPTRSGFLSSDFTREIDRSTRDIDRSTVIESSAAAQHQPIRSLSTLGVYRQRLENALRYTASPMDASVDRWELHLQQRFTGNRFDFDSNLRLRDESLTGASLVWPDPALDGSAAAKDPFRHLIATSQARFRSGWGPEIFGAVRVARRTGSEVVGSVRVGVEVGHKSGPPRESFRPDGPEETSYKREVALGATAQFLQGRMESDYQSLFWKAGGVRGTSILNPEAFLQVSTSFWAKTGKGGFAELRGDIRRTENAPYLFEPGPNLDLTFESATRYYALSGIATAGVQRQVVEGDVSVHWNHLLVPALISLNEFEQRIDAMNPILWLRLQGYLKVPLYKQAAFTRAGISLRYLPEQQSSAAYNPVLGRWFTASDTRNMPSAILLDLHASTRLRWMMIQMSLENALDGLTQSGAFGSPGYPLSGRRFIFGVQVLFKN